MTGYKFSFQGYEKEHMARAVGKELSISTKQSVEICNLLRRRKLAWAKEKLAKVVAEKEAIPFKKFNSGVGHRKGVMGSGRFPVKASQNILDVLNSVEANANHKGLDTNNLVINHISAQLAARPFHYGRQIRRQAKKTHIEVVVVEGEGKKEGSKVTKEGPKVEKKEEVKKELKEAEPSAAKKESKEDVPKVEKKEAPKAEKPSAPKEEPKKEAEPGAIKKESKEDVKVEKKEEPKAEVKEAPKVEEKPKTEAKND